MEKPIFMISLDTELNWGPTTIQDFNFLQKRGNEIRKSIYTLLNLFKSYRIPITWAIVGHLFLDNCDKETCLTWKNIDKYNYCRDWYLDPYTNIKKDNLFYGKDIIEDILSDSMNHEIGYHSFSHPRFPEIPRDMAEDEIREAKKIEKEWGIKLISFVFPCNEIAHLNILKKYGFRIFRGKDAINCDPNLDIFRRKMVGCMKKVIAPPVEPIWVDNIWEIQSSMYFSDPQIPQSLLFRGKLGLKRAIRNKKVFHIWLHPWSLLVYKRLESDLEKFLKYVSKKRAENKITVMTMGELAEYMNSEKRGSHDRF